MLNPIAVIRWNSDKHYLKEIEQAGLKITPTAYLEQGTSSDLSKYFKLFCKEELVVKPVISGGSKNTFRFNVQNVKEIQNQITELLKDEAFMIQPFIEEIAKDGEWSFLFFGGEYSHSLIKKAKNGDFRVQHYLGGTIHPQQPSHKEIAIAKSYVDAFAKGCLYARVDGVYINNNFHLMELELIEPFLFMSTHKEAYDKYERALKTLLQ
jgi:glutathione synthase/RimK-type ligase-like ATP-grasp enzyme